MRECFTEKIYPIFYGVTKKFWIEFQKKFTKIPERITKVPENSERIKTRTKKGLSGLSK